MAACVDLTHAVHEQGATIILQLMHGGRVSDPRTLLDGEQLVSASATQSPGWVLYTDNERGKLIRGIDAHWPQIGFPMARAFSVAEIERIADGFAESAKRPVEAGFDGVEIHGANGYLLHQFLREDINHRSDQYGGSLENLLRCGRLVVEKTRVAIGTDKILTYRFSQDGVDDFRGAFPNGVADAIAFGRAVADWPVDALHWASFSRYNRDTLSDDPCRSCSSAKAACR